MVVRLLERHGFSVAVEQELQLEASTRSIFNVYARRAPAGVEPPRRLPSAFPDQVVCASKLRSFLANQLPEYMVPAAYVFSESMPFSPNGKLDRKALPAPEADAYPTRSYEAPSNDTEVKTAAIWQEVLGLAKVGRDDNFFDLGGDSLRLMRVSLRLQQVFSKPVTVMDLFRYTTVRAIAQHLASDADSQLSEELLVDTGLRRDAMRRRRQLRQETIAEGLRGSSN